MFNFILNQERYKLKKKKIFVLNTKTQRIELIVDLGVMSMGGITQKEVFNAIAANAGCGTSLTTGTLVAGTAPICTCLQLAINHKCIAVYDEFSIFLLCIAKQGNI